MTTPESGDFYESRMVMMNEVRQYLETLLRAMGWLSSTSPRPKPLPPQMSDLTKALSWLETLWHRIREALAGAYNDGYAAGLSDKWELTDLAGTEKATPAAQAFQALRDLAWATSKGEETKAELADMANDALKKLKAIEA